MNDMLFSLRHSKARTNVTCGSSIDFDVAWEEAVEDAPALARLDVDHHLLEAVLLCRTLERVHQVVGVQEGEGRHACRRKEIRSETIISEYQTREKSFYVLLESPANIPPLQRAKACRVSCQHASSDRVGKARLTTVKSR
jgi:hypothetical protein